MKKISLYVKRYLKLFQYTSLFSMYLLFSIVFTWPLILRLNDTVAGHPYGEMWSHLWGLHWVKVNYLKDGLFPFYTEWLNYPEGGGLFFIDPLSGLLAIPIQFFLPVQGAYNLLIIFNLTFGAFCAFLLTDYFVRNRVASFYSGGAYAFSAYYLSYISTGTSEALNIGWMPLFLYFFSRTLFEKKIEYALYSGISLFFIVFSNFYYSEFAIIFTIFITTYYFITKYYKSVLKREIKFTFAGLHRKIEDRPFNENSHKKRPVHSLSAFMGIGEKDKDYKLTFIFIGVIIYRALLLIVLIMSLVVLFALPGRLYNPSVNIVLFSLELLAALAVFLIVIITIWKEFNKLREAILETVKNLYTRNDFSHVRLRKYLITFMIFICFLSTYFYYFYSYLNSFLRFGALILAITDIIFILVLILLELNIKDAIPIIEQNKSEIEDIFNSDSPFRHTFLKTSSWYVLGFFIFNIFCIHRFHYMEWNFHLLCIHVSHSLALLLLPVILLLVLIKMRSMPASKDHCENKSEENLKNRDIIEKTLLFIGRIIKTNGLTFAVMIVVSLILITPYLYIFETSLNDYESVVRGVSSLKEQSGIVPYRIDFKHEMSVRLDNSSLLSDYFAIGKIHLFRKFAGHFYMLFTYSSYMGFITLILAVFGMVTGWKNRFLWFWSLTGVLFLLFSLGPFTSITREIYSDNISPLYEIFYCYFPFFSKIRIPYRFSLCALLSLSIISGYGIKYLIHRIPKIQQGLVVIVLSLGMLFEIMLVSPAPFPIELCDLNVPEFYRQITGDSTEFGIVESPIKKYRKGLYYQTIHNKGTPLSLTQYTPDILSDNLFLLCLYNLEGNYKIPPEIFSEQRLKRHLKALKSKKIKYIVVYNNQLGPAKNRVHTYLSYFLGSPMKYGEDIFVYCIYRSDFKEINKEPGEEKK